MHSLLLLNHLANPALYLLTIFSDPDGITTGESDYSLFWSGRLHHQDEVGRDWLPELWMQGMVQHCWPHWHKLLINKNNK